VHQMTSQNTLPGNELGDSVHQYGARPFKSFTSSHVIGDN
jgi:hypothetical protein